jgi:hypothetical protein
MRHLVDAHDMDVAGLTQPVFQDCRADGILVDDDDLERGCMRGGLASSAMPTPPAGKIPASCQARNGPSGGHPSTGAAAVA